MRGNGENFAVRLLIDQGSELSFISEELVNRLNLRRSGASIPLLGIGSTPSGRTRGLVSITLQSIHDHTSRCVINAYILSRLTTTLPQFNVSRRDWPHIINLPLADPEFFRSGTINIIIGSDYYGSVIMPGLRRGGQNEPTAQQTIFGWILSGPVSQDTTLTTAQDYHCSIDTDLQEILTRFWRQEELPSTSDPTLNKEDADCERHFVTTHSRDSSGRYVVRLPLKDNPSVLGNSKNIAHRCLQRLSHRLSNDEPFKLLYVDFLEEYMSLNHMVEAPTVADKTPEYYLPHHGVLRAQNKTTKLRVVFNGSSRSDNGTSLNDILHAGAKHQTDIFDVLLWTRTHHYVFSTDIVKMFRQISVHPGDWNLQRILWWDKKGQIKEYSLTTVTYGLSCAPFLALRALRQLVLDEGHRFPEAIPPLTQGRYVDDIFGGADSKTETQEVMRQVTQLCLAGGFPLQKWRSNCRDLLPPELQLAHDDSTTMEFEPNSSKILGLTWDTNADTFCFASQISDDTPITKRIILSEIAKLFDPLGLLSPVLIRAKILLQELWLLKIEWDEPLPINISQRWVSFRRQLLELSQLAIPRWLGLMHTGWFVEVHGFADASNLAMAAVVYVRVGRNNDEVRVQLVCSKTKVAPLKPLTIPRLELGAAALLARLIVRVCRALNCADAPVFLWSDSSVTLAWIASHPSRWKDYVRNRVAAIQDTIPNGIWRYVPGKQNPADCASRGLLSDQLIHHDLWWRGPSWLAGPASNWPTALTPNPPEVNLEERPGLLLTTVAPQPQYWSLLDKYSSLIKLLRITALCRRVLARLRCQPQSSLTYPLTPAEIEDSRIFWAGVVQRVWFANELRILSRGDTLPKSNFLSRLTPFIDQSGLLRVGGRLHNANIDAEAKHPIILPRTSPLTTLVIADAHEKTLHGGTQSTLGLMRQSYWIMGGRAPVRSFILRCVRCARYRGKRAQQLMGQLPTARITPARAFLNSGVDYAGPMLIKTWKGRAARTYKGYLAIFVCLATSAIHIELVTEYSTEAFIAAFRRFTGRRGVCATIQSDCGTNFIGADKEL